MPVAVDGAAEGSPEALESIAKKTVARSSQESFLYAIDPSVTATAKSARGAAFRAAVVESASSPAAAAAILYDVVIISSNAATAYRCTGSWSNVVDSVASDTLIAATTTAGAALGVDLCIWTGPGALLCAAAGGAAGAITGNIIVDVLHRPKERKACEMMMCLPSDGD